MTLLTSSPPLRAVFHELSVARVERLCNDAAAVTFAVPEELSGAYAFAAGQSLTLRRRIDGREQRRSYSICAPEGDPPRIGVRVIPDGLFSHWLVEELRPGDRVEVQTPTGSFRADPASGGRHLCVVAGSGITPVLSIAATLLRDSDAEVVLIYGNRTTASVMFAEELGDLKNRYGPRLQIVHVLSREPCAAELLSGRLDADRLRRLLTALVPVSTVDHAWLCGPFAMIGAARVVLQDLGMPDDRVHSELFYVDEPPPELVRAEDTRICGPASEVSVVLDGVRTTIRADRSHTLLDTAQRVRSDLPYACRGGVCGTCRARVIEGEVRMRRNYALEPAEVEAGFVLTCQSLPVTDRVSVDFDR